jgi:hypothetical protein
MTLISKTEQSVGEARVTVAVNDDDVNAGYNDVSASINAAGGFRSFPAGASLGTLFWHASNNAGNYNITCTNASFGQATAFTLPDPGAASANFTCDTGTVAAGVGSSSPGSLTGVTETLKFIRAGVTYYIPLYAVNT